MPPVPTGPELLGVVFAAVLGSLIGSFANVVVYRLPRGESIAFPGSRCPSCGHALRPHELVPVLSWAVQGGRCRSCRSPISARYPLVETLMAVGFALLWLRWSPLESLWAFPLLAALYAVLVILAAIDIDTHTLPDVLTMPALALALLAAPFHDPGSGLPGVAEAAAGAALGAGILVIVNRVGALALRRFADTRERIWPLGFDQVNIAAVAGALGGWPVGVAAGVLSVLVNLVARRPLRIPEPVSYALWVAAFPVAMVLGRDFFGALGGSLIAAGAVAVFGAAYWWIADLVGAPAEDDADSDDEPVAMGFGDVKLAALMGALLGPEKLLLALFLSFVLGAVGGVAVRLLGGERTVPFGPYLALAAVLSLFLGDAIITWYLGSLGL